MSELVKKEVDGHDYEFSLLGARESLKTLTKLVKLLGEPMAIALGAIGGDRDIEKGKKILAALTTSDLLARATRALIERMDEDNVADLVEKLTGKATTMCDGKPIIFNSHYEGRLGHLFKVFGAALEVQFGDFFGVISASLPDSPVQVATPFQPIENATK